MMTGPELRPAGGFRFDHTFGLIRIYGGGRSLGAFSSALRGLRGVRFHWARKWPQKLRV